jgi:hypothetical protein
MLHLIVEELASWEKVVKPLRSLMPPVAIMNFTCPPSGHGVLDKLDLRLRRTVEDLGAAAEVCWGALPLRYLEDGQSGDDFPAPPAGACSDPSACWESMSIASVLRSRAAAEWSTSTSAPDCAAIAMSGELRARCVPSFQNPHLLRLQDFDCWV